LTPLGSEDLAALAGVTAPAIRAWRRLPMADAGNVQRITLQHEARRPGTLFAP
jgi:hypothetical protein